VNAPGTKSTNPGAAKRTAAVAKASATAAAAAFTAATTASKVGDLTLPQHLFTLGRLKVHYSHSREIYRSALSL